jgi:hypothetical protein
MVSRNYTPLTFRAYQSSVADKLRAYVNSPEIVAEGMANFTGHSVEFIKICMEQITAFVQVTLPEFNKLCETTYYLA